MWYVSIMGYGYTVTAEQREAEIRFLTVFVTQLEEQANLLPDSDESWGRVMTSEVAVYTKELAKEFGLSDQDALDLTYFIDNDNGANWVSDDLKPSYGRGREIQERLAAKFGEDFYPPSQRKTERADAKRKIAYERRKLNK